MSRVPWRRAGVALTLGFLLTLPAVNTRIHAADEIENFVYLRSMWFDRDLSFDNEYRWFVDAGFTRDPLFRATFIDGPLATTATGLRPNYAPVGSSILWAPFFAAADVIVRLRGTAPADGLAPPYLTAITIGSAVYGALAVALGMAVARRVTGASGIAASIVVLIGTPLVFYMYAMPGMSHAPAAFAVALFIWTWLRVRDRWTVGGVAALAAAGGLMAMVREQDAFLVLVPAVDYLLTMRATGFVVKDRATGVALKDGVVRAAVAAAVFVLAFLPQLLAYKTLYGRFGPSPVISGKMHWTAPWALAVTGSPEHGWFFWTPLALLAIAGLVLGALSRASAGPGDASRLAALLLLAIVIEVYVVGSLESWHLSGAFGQRRFVSVSVCLAAGMAVLLTRFRTAPGRRVLIVATALLVWWNLGLAIQFGEHSMSRERLELKRNLYRTFIELPVQLPSIAYRYLFDRGSFYQSRVGD